MFYVRFTKRLCQWCHVLFLSYASHGRYHGFNLDIMSWMVKMKGFLQIKCRSNTTGQLSMNLPHCLLALYQYWLVSQVNEDYYVFKIKARNAQKLVWTCPILFRVCCAFFFKARFWFTAQYSLQFACWKLNLQLYSFTKRSRNVLSRWCLTKVKVFKLCWTVVFV